VHDDPAVTRVTIDLQILTGEGFFGQLNAITGWPKPVLGVFLLVTVANNAITGLHPRSPTFSAENQADIGKRNKVKCSTSK
jgi:hypothetical protein